jgi:hypothetical protein
MPRCRCRALARELLGLIERISEAGAALLGGLDATQHSLKEMQLFKWPFGCRSFALEPPYRNSPRPPQATLIGMLKTALLGGRDAALRRTENANCLIVAVPLLIIFSGASSL